MPRTFQLPGEMCYVIHVYVVQHDLPSSPLLVPTYSVTDPCGVLWSFHFCSILFYDFIYDEWENNEYQRNNPSKWNGNYKEKFYDHHHQTPRIYLIVLAKTNRPKWLGWDLGDIYARLWQILFQWREWKAFFMRQNAKVLRVDLNRERFKHVLPKLDRCGLHIQQQQTVLILNTDNHNLGLSKPMNIYLKI